MVVLVLGGMDRDSIKREDGIEDGYVINKK